MVHSSAATDLVSLIVTRLSSDGDLETKGISPSFLIRNWPPAFKEWSTKSVRDAFFAAPQFPRLTNPDPAGKKPFRVVSAMACWPMSAKNASGEYKPFYFNKALMTADVELSDDMFIITKEVAEAYLKGRVTPPPVAPPIDQTGKQSAAGRPADHHSEPLLACCRHLRPEVDRRSSSAKMDEFLHQSSVQVCLGSRLEIDRESGSDTGFRGVSKQQSWMKQNPRYGNLA